ncbi:hypothetical protein PG993_001244 [Apiospora rasikravindrae]|uniref:2EXR domain-containing protein n=1 Tax=Apiospora rasikravindrae TaxID=990691 RepID=A0ABR1UBE8_9PEZI
MDAPPPKIAAAFPRFSHLPTELRAEIWLQAMPNNRRILRLAIHHRTYSTMHSCVTVGGHFCGRHSCCPQYTEGRSSHIGVCMADGFFAVSKDDEDPEDDATVSKALLRSLGSVCRESRDAVVRAYPETLRVYAHWDPRSAAHDGWGLCRRRSRLVRCNPATDILVITSVPEYSSLHPADDGWDQRLRIDPNYARIARQFPHDPDAFRHFRRIISSFQHVSLDYVGSRAGVLDGGNSDWGADETYDSHGGGGHYRQPEEEVFSGSETVHLLFWFESLRQLSLWPNPKWWPEVLFWDRVWVDDVGKLSSDYEELGDALDLSSDYGRYARVQQDHAAADEHGHWVARPKPLPPSKMGCYVPSAWLKGSSASFSL